MNSIVSDKNNQFHNCMKDIKVEQNNLDKMHSAKNNMPTNKNKGEQFNTYFF